MIKEHRKGYTMADLKYLNRLSRDYPNIKAASAEIINLKAILALPKGTEYFLSDLHGEHEAFIHMLKSASGTIKMKIDEHFEHVLSERERDELAALVYNAEAEIARKKRTEKDFDGWCKVSIYRLITICQSVSTKYTRYRVRQRLPKYIDYSIDELLQVEKIDEQALLEKYTSEAETLFRNNQQDAKLLTLWKEAYQKMPNNIEVKEFLMSTYFDIDKVKYSQEILELGMEIYNSNASMFYKGQAIREIAHTYAELGDRAKAEQWVLKSVQVQHCQEVLFSEISEGNEMVDQVAFFTYWALEHLLYMARRIASLEDSESTLSAVDRVETLKTVARLYETVYRNDDMSFESLQLLALIHMQIAEKEMQAENHEVVVKEHLERAFVCSSKAATVTKHKLTLPLLFGWEIQDAPSDNLRVLRWFQNELDKDYLYKYKNTEWFMELQQKSLEFLEK